MVSVKKKVIILFLTQLVVLPIQHDSVIIIQFVI
jgi:hypothetical protein